MIKTVIRDGAGKIINIGPWDDLDGTNPLPIDATSAEEDVALDTDGALRPSVDILIRSKITKRDNFIAEGVTRIAAQVPDADDITVIKSMAASWPSLAANATPQMIAGKNIYLYVRDTVPPKLAAVTTQAELDAIDPTAADPFSDGTTWPI